MPAKLTQEQFINKAKIKHNNYYNYSLVEYIKANIKVKIICPKHGMFEQQPNNHLFGQRCVWCMGDNVRKARTLNHFEFISKFKNKQPELYNEITFKSQYEKNDVKMVLGTKYGDVLISPNKLLEGVFPCISNAINKREYILNYLKIHNNKIYKQIIDIGEYKGDKHKILVKTIYGDLMLNTYNMFKGSGFDIRSAINKTEYLYNYLKIHHPIYITKNIKFLTEFKGNKDLIEFELDNQKYISTPDALMHGYFSNEEKKGRFNLTIIERNKETFSKINCFLYKIRLFNDDESFYKIGITTKDVNIRLRSFPYNNEIIEIISSNLYDAYIMEQNFHNILKNYKYKPKLNFGGKTECFIKL